MSNEINIYDTQLSISQHQDLLYIITCMCEHRWGFRLDIGFIDHFDT
jgi:hypothetical protein